MSASLFEHLSVVELAGDPGGEVVGKVFAQMGADVVKVEPPEGSPSRRIGPWAGGRTDGDHSLTFWYYNTDKRSVVIDYATPEGRDELLGLLAAADVCITTFRPAEAAALGLVAQIHYAWINEHWRFTGLVLPDLQPKPSYHAFRAASSFLAGASYRGPAAYPAAVEGYTFATLAGGTLLDVVWSQDGQPREVALPGGASVFDHYGQPIAADGTIVLDGDPVYVVRKDGNTL